MDYTSLMTEKRIKRLKDVVSKRQFDLTVVLENIHDPHNISAVIRSCDAVGVSEIYVVITDPRIDIEKYESHNKVSSGSRKWVEIILFTDINEMIFALRKKYDKLLGTHLSKDSVSLYDIDFKNSIALVFGNEHEGLSEELLSHLDGNFVIPQYGMVQSLNISVACAVSLYEALRQKELLGSYESNSWKDQKANLYKHYEIKSAERLFKRED